ncbi:MAG: hypothetical protein E4H30_05165 [Methanomassiliicoccus sp.]|nr:MAG: hypothetical protein E4H30_05165 [Methanomassiliicoccus sp.]
MDRKIIWHCECGRDFEMETELRPDRCPFCGGKDVKRVELPNRWSRLFGDPKRRGQTRWWR